MTASVASADRISSRRVSGKSCGTSRDRALNSVSCNRSALSLLCVVGHMNHAISPATTSARTPPPSITGRR